MSKEYHISSYINKLLPKNLKKHNSFSLLLIENWHHITPKWHNNTSIVKISWHKNDNATLYIKIHNPMLKTLIIHDIPLIIKNSNKYLGYNCISNLKII